MMRVLSAPSTSLDVLGATFDHLPHEVLVLDETGTIVLVNEPYVAFGVENGLETLDDTLGTNYLMVCQSAAHEGNRTSGRIAKALQAILDGERERYDTVYDCHSPWENRWFRLSLTRWEKDGEHGVIVVHENATADIQAERAVLRAQQPPEAGDETQYVVLLQERLEAMARRIESLTRHEMVVHGTGGIRAITAPETFMTAFARLLLLSPRTARPIEVAVTAAGRSVLITVDGLRQADREALRALASVPGRCDLGTRASHDGEEVDILLKAARRPRTG